MQADAVAREAFCGLAACPSQAYATLACKLKDNHLVNGCPERARLTSYTLSS